MLYKRIIILIIGILFSINLSAQDKVLDSLFNVLENSNIDTLRIDAISDIGDRYLEKSENDSSIYYYEKALNLSKNIGYLEGEFRTTYMLGFVYSYKSFYVLSEDYFLDALKIAKQHKSVYSQIESLNALGGIYDEKLLYKKALETYFNALELCKQENNKEQIVTLLNNIALIYDNLEEYDKALKYLNKSFKIAKEINFTQAIAAYYMNYGLILKDQGKYDEVIKYYDKSFTLYKDLKDNYALAICYENYGDIYFDLKQYKLAKLNYKKALLINEKVENLRSNASILIGLGDIGIINKEYDAALNNYKKSLEISLKIEALDLSSEAYKKISEYYTNKNNYKQAYSFYVKYKEVNDSISKINNKLKVKEFETKIKREKEIEEYEILKQSQHQTALVLKKDRQIKIGLTIVLVLLLAFIIFLAELAARIKKTNKKLELKNAQIEQEKRNTKHAEGEVQEINFALKEVQRNNAYLIENINSGIAINNVNEEFIMANKAAKQIFETENLVGRSLKEYVDPIVYKFIKKKTNERLQGIKEDYDIEITLKTGELKVLNVKAIPKYLNEEINGTIAIFNDVTKERKVVDNLMRSEENYRRLFENNPVALWDEDYSEIKKLLNEKKKEGVSDFETYIKGNPDFVELCNSKYKVNNVNTEVLKLLRVNSKEEIFSHPHKFFTPASFTFFKKILVAFAKGKKEIKGELVLKDIKGKEINIDIKLFVFDNYKRVIVSMVDVTEKKQAELKILTSELEFRNLFDNNPIALWEEDYSEIKIMLDKKVNEGFVDIKSYVENESDFLAKILKKYTVKRVNNAALKMFKVNDKEYLLNHLFDFFTDSSTYFFCDLLQAFSENKKELEAESIYYDKHKNLINVIIKVNVIKDDYSRVIISFIDITERKKIEQELKNAKLDADRANALKSQFLANMSHEIRTPMNAIIGFSDILYNRIDNPEYKAFVDKILFSGNTLMSLINDILDLSKIEAGELKIQKEPTNISNIVNNIADIFSEKIKEAKLRLDILIDKNIPSKLIIDEIRIGQVIINLVSNAIKFTKQGTVSIFVKAKNKKQKTLDLIISVKDTGIGIPKNQIGVIFEMFRQVDGQSTREFGGTGLGLSITKSLTEMMGGEITVQSSTGGTEFTICFYDVKISLEAEEQKAGNMYFSKTKTDLKILYADDNMMNREVLKAIAEVEGGKVIEATDGEDALEILQTEMPDVILLDIQMPKLSGLEVAHIIRKDAKFDAIPIIALSANVETVKDDVFDKQLIKPITQEKYRNEILNWNKKH